jgi:2-hydroxychromene-2-carboxylate isomerase
LSTTRTFPTPEAIFEIAAKNGIDRSNLEAALQTPEIKARLKDEIDQAMAIGVFGSPTVIIDGEPFFGADRLPQIEHWLETGGF